jgi:hypothetical protein
MVALIAFAAIFRPVGGSREPNTPKPAVAPPVAAVVETPAKKKDEVPVKAAASGQETLDDPCHPIAASGAKEPPDPPAWCQSLGVVRESLGLEPSPRMSWAKNLAEIAEAIHCSGLQLRFMVALVPDPLESGQPVGFDNTLDAIQKGFAKETFRLSRFWLPWKDEAGKRNRWYREEPGILLFQKHTKGVNDELAVVFLVGEAPKAGIERRAFREALQLATGLGGKWADGKVSVLGPSFSGSVDSLRQELQGWPFTFQIATGSATADDLEDRLAPYSFCRTVVPDGVLRQKTFHFLSNELHWRLRRTALLAEVDTTYGQNFKNTEIKDLLVIRFPSRIADVRTAWQHDALQAQDDAKVKVGETLVPIRKPALKLSPEAESEPIDVVPNFSSLTTPAKDLELANVLATISRDGVRYVGILATDVNDKLFLAGQVHRSSPDTILFTIEGNLLFAHPEYGSVMDGTLVASSAPLFTEGALWLSRSTAAEDGRRRQQFESEAQEETMAAARFLLGGIKPPRPRVWISVVGNGSFWPLRVLEAPVGAEIHYCGAPQATTGVPVWDYESWLAGRANLQVVAFASLLCLVSYLLRRAGFLKGLDTDGTTPVVRPVDRRLILFGHVLLAVAAGVVLVVGSIPEWATYLWGEGRADVYWEWSRLLYLVVLVAIYVYLAAKVCALMLQSDYLVLVAWGFYLLPFFLVLLLVALWMPGREIAFFQLRALTLGSGLSPLVSLTLLTSALFAWIFYELERQRLVAGMKTAWPQKMLDQEALAGCEEILRAIELWQEKIFPPALWLWVTLASLFLPAALLLWNTIQPVAETKEYGRAFLVIFLAVSVLALVAFVRFFVLWRQLLRVLRRLHYLPPEWKKTFETLAEEVQWQATRSFAFRFPRFKMLALATGKLEALRRGGWSTPDISTTLREFYQSEAKGHTLCEQEKRGELEKLLEAAGGPLARFSDVPKVREFFAVRVVAHLRYHFAHLRNSLMAATVMGILILVAVTSYFFEPKQFVSLTIWGTLSVAMAMTFWSFLQMDRDATLSVIGGTQPGQISFDKAFFANVALYVVVPALSVVATQFPEVGRLLGRVADEFLRVAGGG